jgi:hypothetical protein
VGQVDLDRSPAPGRLTDCGAGAEIKYVRSPFEDVELDLDGHEVLARDHQLLLAVRELLTQPGPLAVRALNVCDQPAGIIEESGLTLDLAFERLDASLRLAQLRFPRPCTRASVLELFGKGRVPTRGDHSEERRQLDEQLLHGQF